MGTIKVNPDSVRLGGNWTVTGASSASEALKDTVGGIVFQTPVPQVECPPATFNVNGFPLAGNYFIDMSGDGFNLLLDGVETNILDIPTGFLINSPLSLEISFVYTRTSALCLTFFQLKSSIEILYTDIDGFLPGTVTLSESIPNTEGTGVLALFGITGQAIFNLVNANSSNFGCSNQQWQGDLLEFTKMIITGSFTQVSTAWVIENLTRPGEDFIPGDTGRVRSEPTPTNDDFDTVEEVIIGTTTIPDEDFLTQTEFEITFIFPPEIPPGDKPVGITNPTEYTGQAYVGSVTVLEANSSGIYTLTPNKRNDTIYISAPSNDTEDTAIPDPFAKTGYVGG